MMRRIVALCGLLPLLTLGCGMRGTLDRGGKQGECGIRIVYAQSTDSYREGAMQEDPFWTRIEAALSDSTYDFGYLNDLGNFIHVFSGTGGSFEGGGGQTIYFALRESAGKRTVFGVLEYGTCAFAGTQVKANKAILPKRDRDYHTKVVILFDIPGRREVAVTLTAEAPNGFAPAND